MVTAFGGIAIWPMIAALGQNSPAPQHHGPDQQYTGHDQRAKDVSALRVFVDLIHPKG